jgi:predicted signal transduction protein with EAL and GGDEF domain
VADFGSSYSCLSHLHQLPVSTLKIDCSFVERISDPNGTYTIVQAIIALAHNLGFKVVGEGVERPIRWSACAPWAAIFAGGAHGSGPAGCGSSQVSLVGHVPGRETFAALIPGGIYGAVITPQAILSPALPVGSVTISSAFS